MFGSIYTDDHEMFRDSVREFIKRGIAPRTEEFIENRPSERTDHPRTAAAVAAEVLHPGDDHGRAMTEPGGGSDLAALQWPAVVRAGAERRVGRLSAVVRRLWLHEGLPGWPAARTNARVTKIWAGSNKIMKEIIGRDLRL
jgi:alkylation response protein AidB-like acyl-CoA dehydrogenase